METPRNLLALVFALPMLISGCYYDNEEELYGPGCDLTDITYNTGIKPIIQANCQSSACHGTNGSNGELVTYEQLNAVVADGSFRNAVIVTKRMPDGGALSTCELDRIELWLDAGAPNN